MHLYDAIEEYNFTHGKHFDAATGQYDLLMPHDLGRPLTHEEMDYNFLYQKQTMNGFRIFGSGANYKLNIDDIDKVLKFHKIQPADEDYALYTTAGYLDDQYIWIPVELAAAAQPAYVTLTASPNPINETGNSVVTFTLNVVNVVDGTTIDWSIATGSGITAADFVGGLTGTATINGNTASWTVEAATDHITEGNEDFTLTLATTDSAGSDTTTMSQDANGNGGVPLNATVTIGDSSFTPRYNSITGANSIAEGNSMFFTVNTDYFFQAATIDWEVDFTNSTATSADFSGPTSGTINMDASGDGNFGITIATDLINDNENFTVKLVGSDSNGISGQDRSKTVTITNSVFPAYTTFTGPATRLEGQNAQYALNGTNIPNGTQVGYTITGVDLSDISLSSLTGFITMNSNFGQLFFGCLEDNTVDGPDTMVVTLNNVDEAGNATGLTPTLSVSTVISDVAPGYSITGPSSIDEGQIGSYTFTASNMVPGTTVYWELRNYSSIGGSVDFAADFVSARTGNGTVVANGNAGEVELGIDIEIDTDILNEGPLPENFKLVVWDDAAQYATVAPYDAPVNGALATKNISINDLAPTYQIVGDASINEGQTKTYTFKATNFPAGTTVYWELRNYDNSPINFANDITTSRTGNGQVQTNGGFVELDIDITAALDMLTEGSENFKLIVWASDSSYDTTAPYSDPVSGAYATKNITIIDLAPVYTIVASPSQIEPSTLVAELYTQYVAAGTAYTWEVEPTGANPVVAADFVSGVLPSGSGTIPTYNSANAQSDTFNISVIADNTTEGTENYKIVVKVNTVSVAEKTVNVDDTSQTPAAQTYFFHLGAGGGGFNYPYNQDLTGSPLYVATTQAQSTSNPEFEEVFEDMLANPNLYETVQTIQLVSGAQATFPTSGAQNYSWMLIPDSAGIPDLTQNALLFDPNGIPTPQTCPVKLAVTINGVAHTLYRMPGSPTTGTFTLEYV